VRLVVIAVGASLLAAGSATAEPTSVGSQRERAQAILAQVQQIDSRLEHAVEAYNLANVKLDRIERQLEQNKRHLAIARTNFRRAQSRLAERLVSLYTSGDDSSTLAVVLGATSLDDLLRRIDTVSRVSDQDTRVLGLMRTFRGQMRRQAVALRDARAEQRVVVAAREAERASIERQLAERQALLSSIRAEIERMQAAERARQRTLASQVRAQLPGQTSASGVGIAAVSSEGDSVAPPSRYGGVVGIAMRYLGTPYRWGGSSPSTGFDCSGFVMYVYAQVGVSLPHNAAAQYGYGVPVSRSDLQPGDLVFFNGLGHNGIYVGGGNFIHSPHTGDVVKISSMTGWYASTYVGARRL
jgi:cell wall-associated NlpC family hydrolase